MSLPNTQHQSYAPPINYPHAYKRWSERTPAEVSIEEAWIRAIPVEAPECDAQDVRLYAPYDALLVVRGGVLRTVLLSDDRTDLSGLTPCSKCDDLIDPLRSEICPWCDTEVSGCLKSGEIAIDLGGDH